MFRGLYTAATGMNLQLHRQNTIANNLANANTTGYKKDEAIASAFRERLVLAIDKRGEIPIGQASLGVNLDQIYTDQRAGNYILTENPLDLAIRGEGFFLVRSPQGEYLTRNGSFTRNREGFLVTAEGEQVLGEKGPIRLLGEEVVVAEDGTVIVDGTEVDRLLLVRPADTGALEKVGHNKFRVNGEWLPQRQTTILQGRLEQANINPVLEMTKMIEVTRAYESNQKVIAVMDTVMNKVANEIGRL